jgi:hypothetical protein
MKAIAAVSVAAHKIGIPVIGHIPDNTWVEQAFRMGYRSIEHLDGYVASLGPRTQGATPNADRLDQVKIDTSSSAIAALAAATKRADVWNCPTQQLWDSREEGMKEDTVAQWPELRYLSGRALWFWKRGFAYEQHDDVYASRPGGTLDTRRRIITALQAAGAGILSGTDAGARASNVIYMVPGFSLHRELVALARAGLTPYQALATSTRNVAEYFGTLSERGTIAVGKRADVVLLGGNPLADIRNTQRIAGVMHDGRWFSREELDRGLNALVGKFLMSTSIVCDSTCPPAAPGEEE